MFAIVESQALTISAFEYETRSTWTETLEAESGDVVKGGWYGIRNPIPDPWDGLVVLIAPGAWATASFTLPADTLVVQFLPGLGLGIVDFIVDGSLVGQLDTWNNIEPFQVAISGLALAPHTLQVLVAGLGPSGYGQAFVDVFGSKIAAPVPEPTTMFLLGTGLVGLAAFGRKKFLKKQSQQNSNEYEQGQKWPCFFIA